MDLLLTILSWLLYIGLWAKFQCKTYLDFSRGVDEVRDHYLLRIFF